MSVPDTPAPRRLAKSAVLALAALVAALLLAACGSSSKDDATTGAAGGDGGGTATVAQSDSGPLTVWVDSVRLPAAKAYKAAHPDVDMRIVTYDGNANGSGTLKTKLQLFNRVRRGWPDVVFTQDNTDMSWAAIPPIDFAMPLDDGLVDQQTLDGFARGALDYCTVNGRVVCLRNDLAQNVLWYDAPLMRRFGYAVPRTWQQYAALGERLAREHPGYIVGTIGDSWGAFDYLWPNQCPASQVVGEMKVRIDLSDANCTAMARLLDPLLANGVLSRDTVFSPGFAKNQAGRVLMLVGPSWYGGTLFRDTLRTPARTIAAAPPLAWEGRAETTTGNVGGGLWIVSRHSAHLREAAEIVRWMATSNDNQARASTYPAYAPAARLWLENVASSGYFANDIGPALTQAADQVWDGWSATQYNVSNIWANTVVPRLTKGASLSDTLPAFQSALQDYAKAQGYSVEG